MTTPMTPTTPTSPTTPAGAAIAFALVDVFASKPLAGNPLALVPAADGLSETTMQRIAREFNQSETTFIVQPSTSAADIRLRSFTPMGIEVFGAGHNAMGAWIWLAEHGRLDPARDRFVQQIGDALLPVRVEHDPSGRARITMDHSPPSYGAVFGSQHHELHLLARALGVADDDLLGDLGGQPPAQVVSTGAGHLLVAARDRSAVDRVAPDAAALRTLLASVGGEGCYVFSLDSHADAYADSRVADDPRPAAYARFFNPTVGISEDPATGTAAGPLAARLTRLGLVPPEVPVVIEQGTALGRRSLLSVTVTATADGDRVRLTGSGLTSAEGHLRSE